MSAFSRAALILGLTTSLLLTATARRAPEEYAGRGDKRVYVCVSRTSVAYHATPTCDGLGQCTHVVSEVTPTVARKLGKRACYKCYPALATHNGHRGATLQNSLPAAPAVPGIPGR
jgi:hypothetical protein